MGRSKDDEKAAKKAVKARLKAEKKSPGSSTAATSEPALSTLTPAERSAKAAEKQVALQRYRVLLAVLMLVVALATSAITLKPWEYFELGGGSEPEPTAVSPEAPGEAAP